MDWLLCPMSLCARAWAMHAAVYSQAVGGHPQARRFWFNARFWPPFA